MSDKVEWVPFYEYKSCLAAEVFLLGNVLIWFSVCCLVWHILVLLQLMRTFGPLLGQLRSLGFQDFLLFSPPYWVCCLGDPVSWFDAFCFSCSVLRRNTMDLKHKCKGNIFKESTSHKHNTSISLWYKGTEKVVHTSIEMLIYPHLIALGNSKINQNQTWKTNVRGNRRCLPYSESLLSHTQKKR